MGLWRAVRETPAPINRFFCRGEEFSKLFFYLFVHAKTLLVSALKFFILYLQLMFNYDTSATAVDVNWV